MQLTFAEGILYAMAGILSLVSLRHHPQNYTIVLNLAEILRVYTDSGSKVMHPIAGASQQGFGADNVGE